MRWLRAIYRLMRAFLHVLHGLWVIWRYFDTLAFDQRMVHVQHWSVRFLHLLGIELDARSDPAVRGPILLVANHMSWLDIVVILSVRPARFVSKAEVGAWPVVGRLVTGAGTLYIERERKRDAVRMVRTMAKAMAAGDVLAVFPEGTTSDGSGVLPFHANLLQAAIDSGAPIQPLGLAYLQSGTNLPSSGPLFVGDDTFLASVWRLLASPPITARVRFGATEAQLGRSRRDWAGDLHKQVAELCKI